MGDRTADEQRAASALRREVLRVLSRPKNRAKGSWSHHTQLELIAHARTELDEAEAAIKAGESLERIESELGDAGAFIALALDVSPEGAACCCAGHGHRGTCCPGYFRNSENDKIERCDECAIFSCDEDAEDYLSMMGIDVSVGP